MLLHGKFQQFYKIHSYIDVYIIYTYIHTGVKTSVQPTQG